LELGEAFWRALREGTEEARWVLVKRFISSPDEVLGELGRRVGGEPVPDTVVAARAVEVVLASLAVRGRGLRLVVPDEPVPGWGPLAALVEELPRLGLGSVYRVPFWPRPRLRALEAVRRAARVLRGFSARIVDVTDASPLIAAAAQAGGARWLTVLVDYGHVAVFDKFWFVRG